MMTPVMVNPAYHFNELIAGEVGTPLKWTHMNSPDQLLHTALGADSSKWTWHPQTHSGRPRVPMRMNDDT
jgi:hypothetical protein